MQKTVGSIRPLPHTAGKGNLQYTKITKYKKKKKKKKTCKLSNSSPSSHEVLEHLSFTVPHRPVLILRLFYDLPRASDCFHSKRILRPPSFYTYSTHSELTGPKPGDTGLRPQPERHSTVCLCTNTTEGGSWMRSCLFIVLGGLVLTHIHISFIHYLHIHWPAT